MRIRQATRKHVEHATAPLITSNNSPSKHDRFIPRQRTVTTLCTPGEDSNSSIGVEYDTGTDEAESTEDDDGISGDDEDHDPVLDGEVLQEENILLKQELAKLRDRLNHTKTELAFQQSRQPGEYNEGHFIEQLDGLRREIRDWCVSYFENGRWYWTIPAERRFKPLCSEWAAFMADKFRRPQLIQARVWYTLDQLLFNPISEKQASWLFLAHKNSPSIDKMFAQGKFQCKLPVLKLLIMTAAEQSSPANRHTYREWRALTFFLLFPGKGDGIEPNSWLRAELNSRAKHLHKLLWTSLRTYMNSPISREDVTEAKESLREITTMALYFHLDMMKYTTGLYFGREDRNADARVKGAAHMEEMLGGNPKGNVRLMVSPPLYKDTTHDAKSRTRQVLMGAQVFSSVLERQPRTPIEKTISPVVTTRSKRTDRDSRTGRDHASRSGKVRRRPPG